MLVALFLLRIVFLIMTSLDTLQNIKAFTKDSYLDSNEILLPWNGAQDLQEYFEMDCFCVIISIQDTVGVTLLWYYTTSGRFINAEYGSHMLGNTF